MVFKSVKTIDSDFFFFYRSECYPNGTMTAMAVKFESVPTMNLSQLTLNDPTCGPVYTDDRFASFIFSVNSCGTTRKVEGLGLLLFKIL
jgi:hypothetical protein